VTSGNCLEFRFGRVENDGRCTGVSGGHSVRDVARDTRMTRARFDNRDARYRNATLRSMNGSRDAVFWAMENTLGACELEKRNAGA
jgi:hypothetical protein